MRNFTNLLYQKNYESIAGIAQPLTYQKKRQYKTCN